MKEKYGEWIAIDNDPSEEDIYLVAWLPKDLKRKECFIGLAYYDADGWVEEYIDEIRKHSAMPNREVELLAWMPLPEMYKATNN